MLDATDVLLAREDGFSSSAASRAFFTFHPTSLMLGQPQMLTIAPASNRSASARLTRHCIAVCTAGYSPSYHKDRNMEMVLQDTQARLSLLGSAWVGRTKERQQDAVVIGMTRGGKRALLKAEASRLDTSSADLLQLMIAASREKEEAAFRRDNAGDDTRHDAVRPAYWDSAAPGSAEFYVLSNVLTKRCIIEAPTSAQQRTLFFMLLLNELRKIGIRWGFGDCNVCSTV